MCNAVTLVWGSLRLAPINHYLKVAGKQSTKGMKEGLRSFHIVELLYAIGHAYAEGPMDIFFFATSHESGKQPNSLYNKQLLQWLVEEITEIILDYNKCHKISCKI